MPKNTKTMTKRTRKPTAKAPRPLDEQTSALVLAEYLSLEKVETEEIDRILDDVPHGLSHREIAITFRISEVLGVPVAFEMAPRFRLALARARNLVTAAGATTGSLASTEAHR